MGDSGPIHLPVLCDEVIEWLRPTAGQILVDGTLGGGGHARVLAHHVGSDGIVVALDRDPAAVEAARSHLAGLPVRVVQADFRDLPEVLASLHIGKADGVLLDLGMSSDQIADQRRGFSFDSDAPLDLRFNPVEGEPAWKLVNRLSAEHLADLIFRYGEEPCSRKIARSIVAARRRSPIHTSAQLAELIRRCVAPRRRRRIDPATLTFQAFRIAVNDELRSLEIALRRIPDGLRAGGRAAIISFHSLEDRRVKNAFREDPRYEVLTRKPIRPQAAEVERNPRSRSSRLRVAQRSEADLVP